MIKKILLLILIILSLIGIQFIQMIEFAIYKEPLHSQSANKDFKLIPSSIYLKDYAYLNKYLIYKQKQVLDTCFSIQWGIKNNGTFIDEQGFKSTPDIDINAIKAWNKYIGKKEVVIAIIDTGIDYSHEDLKDVIWKNIEEIEGDGIDNDCNGFVDDLYGWNFYDNSSKTYNSQSNEDDHGTHVAGIIAASRNNTGIAGVASNTNIKIMTLKILGSRNSSGSINSMIKAIKYAESMGASICNISAGTYLEISK